MNMNRYGSLERLIGKYLDRAPAIRNVTKIIYQFVNYIVSRAAHVGCESSIWLNKHVTLSERIVNLPHFFGYYDKSPWSENGNKILFHQVDNGSVSIQCMSACTANKRIKIATSKTWNWQQGCMAQWWPGSSNEIIFNTMHNNSLIAKRMSLNGEVVKEYNFPVQAVSPDGTSFISLNYTRLAKLRSDYGYDVEVTNFNSCIREDQDGLWRVNTETGRGNLIICLDTLKKFHPRQEMQHGEHKVNHVMFSPSGKRIVFIHRWIGPSGKYSRLITAFPDGSDLFLLADNRMASHCTWQDEKHVLAWARMNGNDNFFLYTDQTSEYRIIGAGLLNINGDGHPSYSPDKRWILVDTYPGRNRKISLFIYDTKENKIHEIGQFFSPWKYRNKYRCDLHPRWSRNGLSVAIDSTHEGNRGLYIIDVSKIIKTG